MKEDADVLAERRRKAWVTRRLRYGSIGHRGVYSTGYRWVCSKCKGEKHD